MSSLQEVSQDDFDAAETITHVHRQHTIDLLSEAASPLPLADISTAIATRELTESDDVAILDYAQEIHLALYHNHVPRLADMGMVEFSQARMTAALAESVPRSVVENLTESANGVGWSVPHS